MKSLLSIPRVVQWIHGVKHVSQHEENEWGRKLMNKSPGEQWSGQFGERLVSDLLGTRAWKPETRDGMKPDFETKKYIIEVKTGTYWTSGTAHEKIQGLPWKYRNVRRVYNKKLLVILIGRAEIEARKYGLMNKSELARIFVNHEDIEFVAFKDLIKSSYAVDEGSFE